MNIEIQQGRLIDPANDQDSITSLYISDGKILSQGDRPEAFKADEVIDAHNKLVIPGIIDIGIRLGEPGVDHTPDIEIESEAAVSAGITSVCCMPDGPVIDSPAEIDSIQRHQNRAAKAKYHVFAALTKELAGKELSEMASLKTAGCIGVGNAWHAMENAPYGHTALLLALEEYLNPVQTILLRCDADAIEDWHHRAGEPYAPRRMVFAVPNDARNLPGSLAEREPRGKAVAYVCSAMSCSRPIDSLAELIEFLKQSEARQAPDPAA